MKIVGVDPGFSNFGVSALSFSRQNKKIDVSCLYADVLHTKKQKVDGRPEKDFERRLDELADKFRNILDTYEPMAVSMEMLSPVRNSTTMTQIGLAWGMCSGICRDRRIRVFSFPPRHIKMIVCQNVKASKAQMIQAVKRRFPEFEDWPRGLKCEHAADAVGAVLSFLSSSHLAEVEKP